MQVGETVSRGSRHRSNHAQNRVPSVVAGHQFQEFGCIGPESRIFPTTVIVTHPGFCSETNIFQHICLHQTPFSGFAASLWHLLDVLHFQKTGCLESSTLSLFSVSNKPSFQARVTSLKSPASPQLLTCLGCQVDFRLELLRSTFQCLHSQSEQSISS